MKNPNLLSLPSFGITLFVLLAIGCSKSDTSPAPAITDLNPTSGNIGTSVVITGTNFSSTAANNTVKFNGVEAEVNASTATSITTHVPGGATTGAVTITVGGKTATSSMSFTVSGAATTYTKNGAWNCASGKDCQGLYQIYFQKGSKVSLTVDNVSSGSIARIAFYAPGVTTGGTNLLTNNSSSKELLCSTLNNGCTSSSVEGYQNFSIPNSGIYTVAVTRDWGNSCGGTGTYKLTVTSDVTFGFIGSTDDTASAVSTYQCP